MCGVWKSWRLLCAAGAIVGFGEGREGVCPGCDARPGLVVGVGVEAAEAGGEVADGESEDADEVSCACRREAAGEFEGEDGIDGRLERGAVGEVEVVEVVPGLLAGANGVASAAIEVGALGDGVVGVVVDAEAGGFAGGEAAGVSAAVGGGAGAEGMLGSTEYGVRSAGGWFGAGSALIPRPLLPSFREGQEKGRGGTVVAGCPCRAWFDAAC